MCRVPVRLRELVKQKLDAAAEEIFELVERTIAEYEEETERQRRLLETLLQPRVLLHTAERSPSEPPPVNVKEEAFIYANVRTEEDAAPPSDSEKICTVSVKNEEEEETSSLEAWTQQHLHIQTVDCPELNEDQASVPLPLHDPPAPSPWTQDSGDAPRSVYNSKKNKKGFLRHFCAQCGKGFHWASKLKRHSRVHAKEETFASGNKETPANTEPAGGGREPSDAQTTTDVKKKRQVCGSCGKDFRFESDLARHIRIHTGEKPYKCWVCGRGFARKDYLKGHAATHKENLSSENKTNSNNNKKKSKKPAGVGQGKPQCLKGVTLKSHICTKCGKTFQQNYRLQRHLYEVHSQEKPFRCSVCGKRFSRPYVLQSHMRLHKSAPPGGSSREAPAGGGVAEAPAGAGVAEAPAGGGVVEKRFSCSFCGKAFLWRHQLQSHEIIHTGESPFGCSVCGKVLTSRRNLRRHLETHSSAAERDQTQPDQTSLIYCSFMDRD